MGPLERSRGALAQKELKPGTLARFADGLSWFQILDITAGHRAEWWRLAIADSEERGVLEWDRARKVWRLTDAGRVSVRSVS